MTRGQREERPYFGLVTYILVAGVKNLYRCHASTGGRTIYQLLLDDDLDLLDLRFLFIVQASTSVSYMMTPW